VRNAGETAEVDVVQARDTAETPAHLLAELPVILELQGKTLDSARIVVIGAGAAGIASIRLLCSMGAHRDNILAIDREGVIHTGRQDLNPYKWGVAADTDRRTLEEAMVGADIVIGVSGPGLITPPMLASMAAKPIVFALSNPVPEIRPETAAGVRDDLIMATGRSDYPNQVNNVLGFPFIFRGALDARASCINEAMQIAAVHALRDLTHEAVPQRVLDAYGLESLEFGPEYIIPKPLDERLRSHVAPAVMQAAIDSGVARIASPAPLLP
jgi:malate dehydrogenase (oxaloacetate-decarboxylating)(NADP+)